MTVRIHFSDFFEVAPETLESYGAFNISLINDIPLFIDPFLLFNNSKPEYQALHHQIIEYVKFLRDVSIQPGINPGLLSSWFRFPEVKQNWLGYSLIGNRGHGLGTDFAHSLSRSLHTVFANFGAEEITQSSHLEKLCLIKDGVGRDSISDFTTNLIKEFLLNYTQDIATKHIEKYLLRVVWVDKVRFNYTTQSWEGDHFTLPHCNGDFVLLTPKDILTKDDTWINRPDLADEFSQIANSIPNEQLRAQISNYFLRILPPTTWRRGTRIEPTKAEIRDAVSKVIDQFPEILDYYIRYKESRGNLARRISQEKVDETEILFIRQITEFVDNLSTQTGFYQQEDTTYTETHNRIAFLKDVIENKGGHKIFYIKGTPLKRESDLQILFRLVWFGTPSDVSREVDDGRGPVDFKISRGSEDKTLVEFKLASNTQLKRNLESQVPIYEKASDTNTSIKVIMYFSPKEHWKVAKILQELGLTESRDIVLVDARWDNKPSGSKA